MENTFELNLQLFADGGDAGGTPPDGGTQPQDAGGTPPEGGAPGHPDTGSSLLGGDQGGTEPNTAPESYDFSGALTDVFGEGSELDETVSGKFSELLQGVHANQEQAAAMAKFGLEFGRDIGQAVAKQIQEGYVEEVRGWGEAAKKELGGDYESTLAKGVQAVNYIETKVPGFTKMLNITGAGNHVAMIKALSLLNGLLGEDTGHNGSGTPGGGIYDNTDWAKY
mgnify:FL=1